MAPTLTSLSKTNEVFHNLHMLWMCKWMSPCHGTASLAEQAHKNKFPRILDPSQDGFHIIVNHIYCVSQPSYAMDFWICIWMSPHNIIASLIEQVI